MICNRLHLFIDLVEEKTDLAHICSGAKTSIDLAGNLIHIMSDSVDLCIELAQLRRLTLPDLGLVDAGTDRVAQTQARALAEGF